MTAPRKNSKVVAIVQARMGATRFPGKMMSELRGHPLMHWVLKRCRQSETVDQLVVAIPDGSQDDILAEFLLQEQATVFRGSENDVLRRFYEAATHHQAAWVVRICADNPFVSPLQIDNLVRFATNGSVDYAYNHIPRGNTYPDGLGAEIVRMDVLGTIHANAKLPSHREHVFNYLWQNEAQFRIATFDPADSRIARPDLKLDIDSRDDLLRLSKLSLSPDSTDREIIFAAGAL